jgi:hypothetical protein
MHSQTQCTTREEMEQQTHTNGRCPSFMQSRFIIINFEIVIFHLIVKHKHIFITIDG